MAFFRVTNLGVGGSKGVVIRVTKWTVKRSPNIEFAQSKSKHPEGGRPIRSLRRSAPAVPPQHPRSALQWPRSTPAAHPQCPRSAPQCPAAHPQYTCSNPAVPPQYYRSTPQCHTAQATDMTPPLRERH